MTKRSVLRVGIDADGVILDAAEMKARITRELFGLDIPPQEFTRKRVIESGRVTSEQYEAMKEAAYRSPVALTFRFIPGAQDYIQQMTRLGWYTPVLTNRNERGVGFIRELFRRHHLNLEVYSNCPEDGVVQNSKTELIRKLGGLDVYIDDDTDKLYPLVGFVPTLLLFSQPYNSNEDVNPVNGYRVKSWKELFDFLCYARQFTGTLFADRPLEYSQLVSSHRQQRPG